MVDFIMKVKEEQGFSVIEVEGEIDVYTAPSFKCELINLIDSGARDIIIDLSKVDYMDSTALGALINGLKRLNDLDGNLVLVCPNSGIRQHFFHTGLDKIFDICNTVEEATNTITSLNSDPLPAA